MWQDLRYGVRILSKHPGLAVLSVLMLALGIAASTSIFSVVLPLALDLPTVQDPDRLARLWSTKPASGVDRNAVSLPDFFDWRDQADSFERMAVLFVERQLTNPAEPRHVCVGRTSVDFFPLLGVRPFIGRFFLPKESDPAWGGAVILGHAYWLNYFGGDREVLGRKIALNNEIHTVVGVMPKGFEFPIPGMDAWVPLTVDSELLRRDQRTAMVIGRLKAGATWEQARTEMSAIARRLQYAYPDTNQGWGVRVVPVREEASRKTRLGVVFFLTPAILVLLIGCLNVANLLLGRAAAREKEIAVRTALGASRGRLVRQLLTESIILAFLGGALGLVLALWGVDLLRLILSQSTPIDTERIQINNQVLAFGLLLSVLTPAFFGLAPALHATKLNINDALREGLKRPVAGLAGYGLSDLLVVLELFLAVPFLVAALLFWFGFKKLETAELSFKPEKMLTLRISLSDRRYAHDHQANSFYQRVLDEIRSLPGVEAVGASTDLPLLAAPVTAKESLLIENSAGGEPRRAAVHSVVTVSPGYLRALAVPLLQGRGFSDQDHSGSTPVALVSKSMASLYWPGEDCLGKRLKLGPPHSNSPWLSVVGVVGDITTKPGQKAPRTVFLPLWQRGQRDAYVVTRTTGEPAAMIDSVRSAVRAVDKDQPIDDIMPMEQYLSEQLAGSYVALGLLGAFAVAALLLAAVGLYAVMSQSVASRVHEIGVRMALGAGPARIFHLMLRRGMVLALTGLGAGLLGAFAVTRLVAHELAGLGGVDAGSLLGIPLLLLGVALLACYFPARRATKVEPIIALRAL